MTLWLVIQRPKPQWRNALISIAGIYEAKSAAEAVRLALANDQGSDEGFSLEAKDHCKPTAKPLAVGKSFFL